MYFGIFFKLSILPNSVYFDVRHKFGWNQQSIKQTKHDYLWQVEFVRAGKCGYSQPTFVQFSFYSSTSIYSWCEFINEFCQFIKIKVLQRAKAKKQNISNMFKRVWIKTEQYKCFVARATITTIGWGGANRHQTVWTAKMWKYLYPLFLEILTVGLTSYLWIIQGVPSISIFTF